MPQPPSTQYFCPHCHNPLSRPLPVDPVFTLKEAAALIPMSYVGLRNYLSRHRHLFNKRYWQDPQQKRLHRLLTSSEIQQIRRSVLKYKAPDGSRREPTVFGS